jgi:hypothetical protein
LGNRSTRKYKEENTRKKIKQGRKYKTENTRQKIQGRKYIGE